MWPTWLPSYQYSWPPQRSCNASVGSRMAMRSCHAPTMSRRCGGGAGSTASGSITEVSCATTGDSSRSRKASRADPQRDRCRAIIALSPRIGVYSATASICRSRCETSAATGVPIEMPDTTTAVACGCAQRTTARTSDTDAHHARDIAQWIHVRIGRPFAAPAPVAGLHRHRDVEPQLVVDLADARQQQVFGAALAGAVYPDQPRPRDRRVCRHRCTTALAGPPRPSAASVFGSCGSCSNVIRS